MNITKATVCYFTGRGTTKQYAKAFAEALPFEATLHELRFDNPVKDTFCPDELLVVAGPVYAGYLPTFMWEQLDSVQGSKTPAVLLAVYGARDYDNALLEIDQVLTKKGFSIVGAAAVVARHSIATTIAPERPTEDDLGEMRHFAHTIAERLDTMNTIDDAPIFTFKGTVEEGVRKGGAPLTNDACDECGICVDQCPAGAIPEDNPETTNAEICVGCLRCVEVCPQSARSLPEEAIAKATARLQKLADSAKPNEFF